MENQTPAPPLPDATSSEEKLWVVLCHVSLLLGVGLVLPLIVYLVKKDDEPRTADHAREALNFHISVYIYSFISLLLCVVLIGIPMLFLVGVGSLVCAIIAAIQASEGKFYRYPMTIRLV